MHIIPNIYDRVQDVQDGSGIFIWNLLWEQGSSR